MQQNWEIVNRASMVKARYEHRLMRYPNVIGVGVGLRHQRGQVTNEVCIVVMVRHKVPPDDLDLNDRLPENLEGIPVDVLEVGDIEALGKDAL